MRSPKVRALFSLVLFSLWLALLFSGLALGGAVHILLAAGLALFPWRAAMSPHPPKQEEGSKSDPRA
ncbi:MAG TPA: hypothetical protein VLV54_20120 [Thermoanaerobaculia bacterium]|nr:hypothetical protein [Thermoanaerobaculia bacterium]